MARLISGFLQILKLGLIGAFASGIDYIILVALVSLSFPVWVAGAVGYTVGTLIVYFIANLLVFNKSKATKPILEITLFLVTGLVGLVMNSLILEFAINVGIALGYGKLISIFLVFAWNTIARYTVVWLMRR